MWCLRAWFAFVAWVCIAAPLLGQEGKTSAAPEKQAAHFDFDCDPLPADALVRIGTIRLRHGSEVKDVAFSPDGKMLASAGYDHAVRLWDVETGKEIRRFRNEAELANPFTLSRWLSSVSFSPDGKRLACGEYAGGWSANRIRVFDVETGKLLFMSEGSRGGVPDVAFSRDGNVLASAGSDGTINLWDSTNGTAQLRMTGHEGPVWSVAWSPKGELLASAGQDRTIRLWDPKMGRTISQFARQEAEALSVSFSPDGQTLVSGGGDQTVRLWETATGKQRALLGRHDKAVARVAFAPDGKTVASASADRTVKLWDVASGKLLSTLEGHQSKVRGLAFSPDGKTLATGSDDTRVGLWDVTTGNERNPRPGHRASCVMIGFLPGNDKLVSLSRDETIRWWDWKQGKQERSANWQHIYPGRATAFSPAGDLLSVGSRQSPLRLMEAKTGKELGPPEDGKRLIVSASFSPDGRTLATVDSLTASPQALTGTGVSLWEVSTRKVVRRVAVEVDGLHLVLFAPNGKILLGGAQTSQLWDIDKDKPAGPILPLPFAQPRSAVFTPDSRFLASGNLGGNVEVWDVEMGEKARVLTGLAGYVMTVSVSPDSRLLAAGGWCGIKIWEIATGLERRSFDDFEGNAFTVAFSSDGRALASGCGRQEILVWDIPGTAFLADPKIAADAIVPRLWQNLAAADGPKTHRAIWGLAARPAESVAYLKNKLTPVSANDAPGLAQLIKDLDNDAFAVREKATKEIQNLGDLAEPALRRLMLDPPSLEAKYRGKRLLEQLAESFATPERLQRHRAIEALENMGTPQARALLQELSRGAPEARFTRESIASLERLQRRIATKP